MRAISLLFVVMLLACSSEAPKGKADLELTEFHFVNEPNIKDTSITFELTITNVGLKPFSFDRPLNLAFITHQIVSQDLFLETIQPGESIMKEVTVRSNTPLFEIGTNTPAIDLHLPYEFEDLEKNPDNVIGAVVTIDETG